METEHHFAQNSAAIQEQLDTYKPLPCKNLNMTRQRYRTQDVLYFDDTKFARLRDMSQQPPSSCSDGEDGMARTKPSSDPGLEDRAVRIRNPTARFRPLQPGSTGRLHVRLKHVYRE